MPKCILTCRTRATLGNEGGNMGILKLKWSPTYILPLLPSNWHDSTGAL